MGSSHAPQDDHDDKQRVRKQELEELRRHLRTCEELLASVLLWASRGCPPAQKPAGCRGREARDASLPRLDGQAAHRVLRRLEGLEGVLLNLLGTEGFAALCWAVLPELFADRGQAKQPCGHWSGTLGKVDLLAARAERGERLQRPDDAQLPDEVGLVYQSGLNGNHRPRMVDDVPLDPEVCTLQGEDANGPQGDQKRHLRPSEAPRRRLARGNRCHTND